MPDDDFACGCTTCNVNRRQILLLSPGAAVPCLRCMTALLATCINGMVAPLSVFTRLVDCEPTRNNWLAFLIRALLPMSCRPRARSPGQLTGSRGRPRACAFLPGGFPARRMLRRRTPAGQRPPASRTTRAPASSRASPGQSAPRSGARSSGMATRCTSPSQALPLALLPFLQDTARLCRPGWCRPHILGLARVTIVSGCPECQQTKEDASMRVCAHTFKS